MADRYDSLDTIAEADEYCVRCGGKIKMMSARGTGYCCENCKDGKTGRSGAPLPASRRNHDSSAKPAPQKRSQKF